MEVLPVTATATATATRTLYSIYRYILLYIYNIYICLYIYIYITTIIATTTITTTTTSTTFSSFRHGIRCCFGVAKGSLWRPRELQFGASSRRHVFSRSSVCHLKKMTHN